MSTSGHSQRKHRRRNPIGEFLDRLRGKKKHRPHHRSEFPGINMPIDYAPEQFEQRDLKSGSSKRKKSIFDSINLYFKHRALRREERQIQRMKRKARRKHQQEYSKKETGRSIGQKLFIISEEGEGVTKEKKIPLFSQRNHVFRNLTITVNSVFVFLITYVLAYLFYWLTCMLVASWYGLDSTLYFYDLKFNNHSTLWNRFNILLVTGIPPFLCLFLGIFLYRVLFKKRRFVGLQKLFILWSAFHLFNHFFGAFPSGIITDEGFGYVAAWMYMNTAFKFMFSLISLFALGVIGYFSAQSILETSDSLNRVKPENRVAFLLLQIALPWLIGTIIMLLIRMPENFIYPYETLMLFSTIFLVIPPFFNEKVKPRLNLLKVKKSRHINLGYLAMMLALLLFLRIMLGIGLHFFNRDQYFDFTGGNLASLPPKVRRYFSPKFCLPFQDFIRVFIAI